MLERLKKLPQEELVKKLERLAKVERRITIKVLWHFRAVEVRRIYAEMGFSSMYDFAINHLGYSEGSAHRRIAASRLLQELPQMEETLKEGKLNLTTASMAQNFFKMEAKSGKVYSSEKKAQVVKSLEGKSRLKAEKELSQLSPRPIRSEQERVVSPTETEIRITISDELRSKLELIKSQMSHKNPNPSWAELLEHLADQQLKRTQVTRSNTSPEEVKNPESAYIAKAVKAHIETRAGNQCEYVDRKSGRRCASKHRLQFDHITPRAKGGLTTPENLRLLCQSHNLWAAVRSYGEKKMERYLIRKDSLPESKH